MTCEIISYVPPVGVGHPESFIKNFTAYRTEFPISLYSDYPPWNLRHCENPARVTPRQIPHYTSNFSFLLGLRYAIDKQLTYFIYAESDCRVYSDYWDRALMEEFLKTPGGVSGGSSVIYNPSGSGGSALKRATEYVCTAYRETGIPIPLYGYMSGCHVYSNGAAAVYQTNAVASAFRGFNSDIAKFACMRDAWDCWLGKFWWATFGEGAFDVVRHLKTVYSGCTNDLISEDDRIKLLVSGEKKILHQVKGPWF